MPEEIVVNLPGRGNLVATKSSDADYPGIDVEFVSSTDNGENLSRPRVLIEWPSYPHCGLRVLVWDDPNSEDFTHEITFPTTP